MSKPVQNITFTALAVLFCAQLTAQKTCNTVLNDGRYHSAKAQAQKEKEARLQAADLLLNQISTIVSSGSKIQTVETEADFKQIYTGTTSSMSKLRLKGLKYITCETGRRNKQKSVVAYISKEDLKKSANEVSAEVNEYLQLIENKIILGLNPIADIYKAYLYTYNTPYPVKGRFKGEERNNVQIHLRNALTRHLAQIEIEAQPAVAPIHGIEEQFSLALQLQNAETNGLLYTLQCPTYSTLTTFKKGKASLPLILRPSGIKEQMNCELSYRPTQTSAHIAEAAEMMEYSKPVVLTADFSEVISIDFTVRTQSNYYILTPETKSLSVRTVEWNYGNQQSNEQLLRIERENAPEQVTLTINGIESLSVTKKLTGKSVNAKRKLHPLALELRETVDYQTINSKLNQWKNEGAAAVGKKTDFQNPQNCWVALIDPDKREMKHLLSPGNTTREDILTSKTYNGFEKFKGLIAIWLEFY